MRSKLFQKSSWDLNYVKVFFRLLISWKKVCEIKFWSHEKREFWSFELFWKTFDLMNKIVSISWFDLFLDFRSFDLSTPTQTHDLRNPFWASCHFAVFEKLIFGHNFGPRGSTFHHFCVLKKIKWGQSLLHVFYKLTWNVICLQICFSCHISKIKLFFNISHFVLLLLGK
jgi:hypothetical protein